MKRILLAEDDEVFNCLLGKILSITYKVVTVSNGKDAWSWLSEGNLPDLIVSDIKMPLMNGLELLENLYLSGSFKSIPVIILSGLDDHRVREKCFDFGAIAYLMKPFEPQKLLKEVEYPFKRSTIPICYKSVS